MFSQPDACILMGGAAIATLVSGGVPVGHVLVGDIRDGGRTGWRPLTTVSQVFFWIALAAWVLTSLRFGRAHIR